jgi:hypothetical protein
MIDALVVLLTTPDMKFAQLLGYEADFWSLISKQIAFTYSADPK